MEVTHSCIFRSRKWTCVATLIDSLEWIDTKSSEERMDVREGWYKRVGNEAEKYKDAAADIKLAFCRKEEKFLFNFWKKNKKEKGRNENFSRIRGLKNNKCKLWNYILKIFRERLKQQWLLTPSQYNNSAHTCFNDRKERWREVRDHSWKLKRIKNKKMTYEEGGKCF